MKVSDFICAARARLWDQHSKLIPEDWLFLEFINSALCDHPKNRPELYVKPRIVKLKEGNFQQPDCCGPVSKVDVLTDSTGETILAVLKTSNALANTLFSSRSAGSCVAASASSSAASSPSPPLPSSISYDPNLPAAFMVSPPVAKGQDVYARVYCVESPTGADSVDSEVNLDCGNYEDIMRFVLGSILMTVPGSTDEANRGKIYLDQYYGVQGAQRKVQNNLIANRG